MTELKAGALITPSVRLVRQLGEGGMGSVWVADHLGLHTQVVVKFMAESLVSDAGSVARFSREAAAASNVKSQHVVQMFDHGVSATGTPFIVMELLEGEDLAHRLVREGKLPPGDVAAIVQQVSKALAKAHQAGFVHRDIKPENIFLCDTGEGDLFVKVLDFGIAKSSEAQVSGKTATGQMVGTPYYMSPEQMMGSKTIDHRTDLWSLSVVAFQALTGVRPFDGETVGALAVAVHSMPLPMPTAVDNSLPFAVDEWFKRACARAPDERYQSAREVSDRLGEALGFLVSRGSRVAADKSGGFAASGRSAFSDSGQGHQSSPLAMERTQQAGSGAIPGFANVGTHSAASVPIAAESRPKRGGLFVALGLLAAGAIVGVTVLVMRTTADTGTKAPAASEPKEPSPVVKKDPAPVPPPPSMPASVIASTTPSAIVPSAKLPLGAGTKLVVPPKPMPSIKPPSSDDIQ